jgi:gluconate 2-dehydrogenase gamma chain
VRKVTRREVLTAVGAAAVVPAALLATAAVASPGSAGPAYAFFNAAEARFIEAACERLIPADASGAGALGAGVPGYLDRHLAGAWGDGEQLYRNGPWQPGTPSQGQSRPFKPATLFRSALSSILRDLEKRGATFSELPAHTQDSYLHSLESGRAPLDGVPSAAFFDMLLAMTVEGFFSHPHHGSVRDRVAWPMHGYPGALAGCPATAR